MIQHLRKMEKPGASLLLLLLICTDFIFLMLHPVIGIYNPDPSLCITSGMCAFLLLYHLLKLFWTTILFAYIIRISRCYCYISWLLVFTYFFVDDGLLLHQKIGERVSNIYSANFPDKNIFSARIYELAVLAMAGLILLAIVAWAYSRGTIEFRKVTIDLFILIAPLVFFGLIVDFGNMINLDQVIILILELVEDVGEQVINSFLLWYVFLLAIHRGKPKLFLQNIWFKS